VDIDRYVSVQLQRVFSAFALVAGLAGVVVQVLTASGTVRTVSTLVLFATAAALGLLFGIPEVLRWQRARRSLPSEADLDRAGGAYIVEQATSEEIGWVAKLEASVYSTRDAVPEVVLREWFASNPTGFSVVKTAAGDPAGHLDILPLRPGTLEQFLAGQIVEREIRGDSLYSPKDRESIKHLYVESVILCPPKGRSTAAAMLAVLLETGQMIERVADWHSVEAIFAIAATAPGEGLLRKLGFELLKSAGLRRDGHDLFRGTPAVIANKVVELCGTHIPNEHALMDLLKQGL
jgi:hypothetical protein